MRKKGFGLAVLFVLALAAGAFADQYKVVGEAGEFYFGHISYVDLKEGGSEPLVLREGKLAPEPAVLNLPLGPGDAIQTPGASRCEIQFDNGTIVRLDANTKLKIEAILAKSLSTARKISNLLLAQGQVYVMYRRYDSLETFQVITPRAAVKLNDNAVALIEMSGGQTAVQVERGRAEVLYGEDKNDLGQKKVNAGERVVVDDQDILQPVAQAAASEFKAWNEEINANFPKLHEGNALPKPYQNLPKAVFEFAQKFGNVNGEWIWHDLYGYVWRPYLNDLRYPWGNWQANWQPYFYGNWTDYKGQLYWVPGEPWGWVPYHLGLWMWDKKAGWVWMPGSMFAPAWVDWEFFFGDYFWRPFSLFDFYDGWPDYYFDLAFLPGYGTPGSPAYAGPPPASPPVRNVVTKDGLKKKTDPPFPVPKELRASLKAVGQAVKRGDERILASYRETIRQSVIVRKEDFGKPGWQAKVIPFDRFLERPDAQGGGGTSFKSLPSETVARDALRQFSSVRIPAEFKSGTSSKSPNPARPISRGDFIFNGDRRSARPEAKIQRPADGAGQTAAKVPGPDRLSAADVPAGRGPQPSGLRFRDWNPDVRVALRLGVDISYLSRTNEVLCPQLGLRSHTKGPGMRLSPDNLGGFLSRPGGGAGFGSSGGLSSGTSQGSVSSPSSSAPRGSSKESGGGKKG
jgi:hypothetical protein